MNNPLVEYFRCPEHLAVLQTADPLPSEQGYFKFGDAICYGRQAVGAPSPRPDGNMVDVSPGVSCAGGAVLLPFDLSEVLGNLRYERYPQAVRSGAARIPTSGFAHGLYYFARPILPIPVRKRLQRIRWAGWRRIAFPRWPVDVTVETLMRRAAGLVFETGGIREFPFIWFWPDAAPGCVMMTHDVEGPQGAARVSELLGLDESFGIRSAFQLVPEANTSRGLLAECRRRGFEVNVHDLNHDGHLFSTKALFERRAIEINRRVREWGSRGFRSGAMNRRQDWFTALDVAYDMSVPNVAHLEPQQGGCCTVMPHFINGLLELPLTTAQDYTLFHVLGDYSTDLWEQQIDTILAENGVISFIVHPDYQAGKRERDVYVALLTLLARLRDEQHVWVALPSEIDSWWRNRREMTLVPDGASWRVEGPGSERARVAYARLAGGRVVYEVGRPRRAA